MANTLTGTELFTFGWFTTNAVKQIGNQIFTDGMYREYVSHATGIGGIELFTDGMYVDSFTKNLTAEQLFSFGIYRGTITVVGGTELIWSHVLSAKKRQDQFLPI